MKNNKILAGGIFACLFTISLTAQPDSANVEQDSTALNALVRQGNLIEAVISDSSELVGSWLERGSNPDSISEEGFSALMYAAEIGNLEIIDQLLTYGANVNFRGFQGSTPLFMAVFNRNFDATEYLLQREANPNLKDDFGVTPLLYAAASNQYQIADLLLFFNADEKASDAEGNDPLITAVTFENLETTDVLLQNRLNPDVRDIDGNTPLIIAVQHGTHAILELLLEFGAQVNIANNKNLSPLAYAIIYKDARAATILLNQGADVQHEISDGKSIADLAQATRNDSIIQLVRDAGGKPGSGLKLQEYFLTYETSFNGKDYLHSFGGSIIDNNYGLYFKTGMNFRPFLQRIQTVRDDTIFQFRERRLGWDHGIGKLFRLYENDRQLRLRGYTEIVGILSFPKYMGTGIQPRVDYSLKPSAGLVFTTRDLGVKFGLDWYKFGYVNETGLKANVTLVLRFSSPDAQHDRKEIYWE